MSRSRFVSAPTVSWLAAAVSAAVFLALAAYQELRLAQVPVLALGTITVLYLVSHYEVYDTDQAASPVELGAYTMAALAGPAGALCATAAYGLGLLYQERRMPEDVPPARPYRLVWSAAAHGWAALACGFVTGRLAVSLTLVLPAALVGTAAGLLLTWVLLNALTRYDFGQAMAGPPPVQFVTIAVWVSVAVWGWRESAPITALVVLAPIATSRSHNDLTVSMNRLFLAERDRKRLLELTISALDEQRNEMVDVIHAGALQQLSVASMLTGLLGGEGPHDPLSGDRVHAAVLAAADQLRASLQAFAPVGDAMARTDFEGALTAAVLARAPSCAEHLTVSVTYREEDLTDRSAHHLLRIALEATLNAFQHNPAGTRVTVTGHVLAGRLRLQIADGGRGVSAPEIARRQRAGHIGVALMQERANWLDATFTIGVRPGGGTSVVVVAPLPQPLMSEAVEALPPP